MKAVILALILDGLAAVNNAQAEDPVNGAVSDTAAPSETTGAEIENCGGCINCGESPRCAEPGTEYGSKRYLWGRSECREQQ